MTQDMPASSSQIRSGDLIDDDVRPAYLSLLSSIEKMGSLLVAYSGGIDSTLLAYLSSRILQEHSLAVMADSPLLSSGELEHARRVSELCGFTAMVIEHPGFDVPELRHNAPDRCYHCKAALFRRLIDLARTCGIEHVTCGENADDLHEVRPGQKAIREMGISTPLADCGIDKKTIRTMAAELGLPNASQPSAPCLATRFPVGCDLTAELLDQIREAESQVRKILDPVILRIRSDGSGDAIVQLDEGTLDILTDTQMEHVIDMLHQDGFDKVSFARYVRS